MFWYTLVASGIYGQIVHDALFMVFVVCHLSSFGTVGQLWYSLVTGGTLGLMLFIVTTSGTFWSLVVLFGLLLFILITSGTLWSHVAHLGH